MAAKVKDQVAEALEKDTVTLHTGLFASPSGRTEVFVHIQKDGAFRITADRDGRRIHDFAADYEQGGVDAPPKRASD